jgi:hypothetical protein
MGEGNSALAVIGAIVLILVVAVILYWAFGGSCGGRGNRERERCKPAVTAITFPLQSVTPSTSGPCQALGSLTVTRTSNGLLTLTVATSNGSNVTSASYSIATTVAGLPVVAGTKCLDSTQFTVLPITTPATSLFWTIPLPALTDDTGPVVLTMSVGTTMNAVTDTLRIARPNGFVPEGCRSSEGCGTPGALTFVQLTMCAPTNAVYQNIYNPASPVASNLYTTASSASAIVVGSTPIPVGGMVQTISPFAVPDANNVNQEMLFVKYGELQGYVIYRNTLTDALYYTVTAQAAAATAILNQGLPFTCRGPNALVSPFA